MDIYVPHSIPKPYLVLTGFSYFYPLYIAYMKEEYYLTASLMFLIVTTTLFHSIGWKYFFYLDVTALLNYIGYGFFLLSSMTSREAHTFLFATCFAFYTFFFGQQNNIFCFDTNFYLQMAWHGMMHLFSAYSAVVYLENK